MKPNSVREILEEILTKYLTPPEINDEVMEDNFCLWYTIKQGEVE